MKAHSEPPFLVFPDREGGFFVFSDPVTVFSGPELKAAEALAKARNAWLAGGLKYGLAESPGDGWWGVFDTVATLTSAELEALADRSPVRCGPLTSVWSDLDYGKAFTRVKDALEAGLSYQVNLTFQTEGRVASGQPWSWRSALRLWLALLGEQGKEGSFAVLGTLDHPQPILASVSPELFFQREGSFVVAKPMKGTAVRDLDPARDAALRHELATGPKTRAENLMVTDMLRNDLGRLAVPGAVTVPYLFEVEAYPTVWQMTSTVRAEVPEGLSLGALMEALFPCASITGAPKVSTQAIIEAVEADPRGWYTGTLGWYRPGFPSGGPPRGRFSVLIRTLVFDGEPGRFRLGVGGGVVWDSTAEHEWDEAWAKSLFLRPTRREFSLTEAVLWEPEGGLFLLPEHEARLGAACRDFGGTLAPGALRTALAAEVERWRLSGGGGPIKLRVLVDPDFRLHVESEPLSVFPEVLTATLAREPFGPETLLWRRYKTTHRQVYESARVPGVDQTIHFNHRGELTESTSMTLVLETGGRFLTPALTCGLLDGTLRARLVADGTLVEAVLPVESLASADQVWFVNSVRRWKKVRLVNG